MRSILSIIFYLATRSRVRVCGDWRCFPVHHLMFDRQYPTGACVTGNGDV